MARCEPREVCTRRLPGADVLRRDGGRVEDDAEAPGQLHGLARAEAKVEPHGGDAELEQVLDACAAELIEGDRAHVDHKVNAGALAAGKKMAGGIRIGDSGFLRYVERGEGKGDAGSVGALNGALVLLYALAEVEGDSGLHDGLLSRCPHHS